MNSVVIYASHFGNTQKVAEAMAVRLKELGPVELFAAEDAPDSLPYRTELLIVGGPTEQLHMTAAMSHLLARLQPLDGVAAAAFDTRIRPRWWLPGHAANGIAKGLDRLGANLVAPPEGFIVEGPIDKDKGQYPTLVPGELERAAGWAASLATSVDRKAAVPSR